MQKGLLVWRTNGESPLCFNRGLPSQIDALPLILDSDAELKHWRSALYWQPYILSFFSGATIVPFALSLQRYRASSGYQRPFFTIMGRSTRQMLGSHSCQFAKRRRIEKDHVTLPPRSRSYNCYHDHHGI